MAGVRDAATVSLGAGYRWGRFPLRLGLSYRQWYYSVKAGQDIHEYRVHVGTGIPIPDFGSLDIGAGVGRRVGGVLSETVASIGLSLAYHESWLKRTRRWGY